MIVSSFLNVSQRFTRYSETKRLSRSSRALPLVSTSGRYCSTRLVICLLATLKSHSTPDFEITSLNLSGRISSTLTVASSASTFQICCSTGGVGVGVGLGLVFPFLDFLGVGSGFGGGVVVGDGRTGLPSGFAGSW